jgi:hypothetical protein
MFNAATYWSISTPLGAPFTRMLSCANPSLAYAAAITGPDEFTVIVASTRSPMPRITESVSRGTTGNPSVCVTVIFVFGTPTRNAVSPPALMIRSRIRCPAR